MTEVNEEVLMLSIGNLCERWVERGATRDQIRDCLEDILVTMDVDDERDIPAEDRWPFAKIAREL